jgi:hypothetical protein
LDNNNAAAAQQSGKQNALDRKKETQEQAVSVRLVPASVSK